MVERQTTLPQGPSADNQTTRDRSQDSNQDQRQPTTQELVEANGLDTMSVEEALDLSDESNEEASDTTK